MKLKILETIIMDSKTEITSHQRASSPTVILRKVKYALF